MQISPKPLSSGNNLVDGLLPDYVTFGPTLNYSFGAAIPQAILDHYANRFEGWDSPPLDISNYEKFTSSFREAFNILSSYSGLKFSESSAASSDIVIYGASDVSYYKKISEEIIRDSEGNPELTKHSGYASVPKEIELGLLSKHHIIADLTNDNKPGMITDYNYDEYPDSSGFRYSFLIHEALHNLGFQHTDKFSTQTDIVTSSIMSYNRISLETPYGQPVTPMAIDVATLHHLYGASIKASGSTKYSLIDPGGVKNLDHNSGHVAIGRDFYMIWDTGGIDEISYSGGNSRVIINLNEATLVEGSNSVAEDIANILTMYYDVDQLPEFIKNNLMNSAANAGGFISTTFNGGLMTPGGYMIANSSIAKNGPNASHFDTGIEVAKGGNNDDILIGNHLNNSLFGGKGNDFIYGGVGDDYIEGGEGDDILIGGSGFNTVKGGAGDDLLIVTSSGYYDGGIGNDTFDLTNYTQDQRQGLVDGGAGHDVMHLKSLDGLYVNLRGDGPTLQFGDFSMSSIEEFRVNWKYDAIGFTWSTGPFGETFSIEQIYEKALKGEIANSGFGLRSNNQWTDIGVCVVPESLDDITGMVTIFSGKLKDDLPAAALVTSVTVNFDGQSHTASYTVANGMWTISINKSVIANVSKDTVYTGIFNVDYSQISNPDFSWSDLYFGGIVRNIFNPYNEPTEIVTDDEIEALYDDIVNFKLEVDVTNIDHPVIWSIISDNADLFSITEDGWLSSNGSIDFSDSQSQSITVQASDGITTITKVIVINAMDYINDIDGTNDDDILYGTWRDDVILGEDGDDILFATGGYDILHGGDGNDTLIVLDGVADLYGGDGDDILIGGEYEDYFEGGAGNDIIYGGGHKDIIWGDQGADIFVYKDVSDSDYWDLDRSDEICDLEDDDAFDFTELGDVSFDWDNGPAGSIYVEVIWESDFNYGYLAIDVDRDGEFDMAIDFYGGEAGLTQINFVNGPSYYLDDFTSMRSTSTAMARLVDDELFTNPVVDNTPDVYHQYQWAA